jgi:hypothetical protein
MEPGDRGFESRWPMVNDIVNYCQAAAAKHAAASRLTRGSLPDWLSRGQVRAFRHVWPCPSARAANGQVASVRRDGCLGATGRHRRTQCARAPDRTEAARRAEVVIAVDPRAAGRAAEGVGLLPHATRNIGLWVFAAHGRARARHRELGTTAARGSARRAIRTARRAIDRSGEGRWAQAGTAAVARHAGSAGARGVAGTGSADSTATIVATGLPRAVRRTRRSADVRAEANRARWARAAAPTAPIRAALLADAARRAVRRALTARVATEATRAGTAVATAAVRAALLAGAVWRAAGRTLIGWAASEATWASAAVATAAVRATLLAGAARRAGRRALAGCVAAGAARTRAAIAAASIGSTLLARTLGAALASRRVDLAVDARQCAREVGADHGRASLSAEVDAVAFFRRRALHSVAAARHRATAAAGSASTAAGCTGHPSATCSARDTGRAPDACRSPSAPLPCGPTRGRIESAVVRRGFAGRSAAATGKQDGEKEKRAPHGAHSYATRHQSFHAFMIGCSSPHSAERSRACRAVRVQWLRGRAPSLASRNRRGPRTTYRHRVRTEGAPHRLSWERPRYWSGRNSTGSSDEDRRQVANADLSERSSSVRR